MAFVLTLIFGSSSVDCRLFSLLAKLLRVGGGRSKLSKSVKLALPAVGGIFGEYKCSFTLQTDQTHDVEQQRYFLSQRASVVGHGAPRDPC